MGSVQGHLDKSECSNNRSKSMLSILREVFGREVIEMMVACTKYQTGLEQCDFRRGKE